MKRALDIALLLFATAALIALFTLARLPAAFLLGAMGGAIVLAARGTTLKVPAPVFTLAQAVVGLLVARTFTRPLFAAMGHHPFLFVGTTLSVLLLATLLGFLLTRLRILPGSTALWGSFPGGATVMIVMAEAYGADVRLVALMQYLRVVLVALTASVVARVIGVSGAAAHRAWLGPVTWPHFAITVALILFGGLLVPRVRLAAGALLVPLALGALLQDLAGVKLELPQLLLVASYCAVGWVVGLRFTADTLRSAARALPRVLVAIVLLIALCAAIGFVLSRIAHFNVLTGYLATSPGGADSVAIIAAGTAVDAPFVMATQIGRALATMLIGPWLAKAAVRLTPRPQS